MAALTIDPVWPAWAHDQNWCWTLSTDDKLQTASAKRIKSGQLEQIVMIDSKLNFFRVRSVRVLGWAGIYGWKPGFSGRYRHIALDLQFLEEKPLDKAKEYIMGFLRKHPKVYDYDERYLDLISSSTSVDELFARLK